MFGDRLRELREDKNMTQDDLASILNVSRQTISGYEKGVNEPNIENLVRMAEIFNVSLDYLLGRTKIKNAAYIDRIQGKELIVELLANEDMYSLVNDLVKVLKKHK
jgi:transcriptional regulator with XRE-family HTH domain